MAFSMHDIREPLVSNRYLPTHPTADAFHVQLHGRADAIHGSILESRSIGLHCTRQEISAIVCPKINHHLYEVADSRPQWTLEGHWAAASLSLLMERPTANGGDTLF